MIAHIFRLSVWEWHKLRRRWLPWVLLAIVVTLMQAAVWGAYVVHRSEPFSPAHGIQLSDTEGENKGNSLRSGMEVQGRARRPHSAGNRRAR